MLPVFVWAATFTFGTTWLFFLMNTPKDSYVSDVLLYSLVLVISANIATLTIVFIASYYHENYKKELQSRMFLMLANIPVAALYFILMCRFAKFLN
jgi:hypothetical protein